MMAKDTFRKVIRSRRSVRKFLPKTVPLRKIRHLIRAAGWAPSAHNSQPWRFIAVTNAKTKTKLATKMAEVFERDLRKDQVPKNLRMKLANASIRRFAEAPVLIIPCLDMKEMNRYSDERQAYEYTMAIQSVSAAINTLLLCAHAEGLGACWYCSPLFCREEVRESLGIPRSVDPQALVTLGYPTERPVRPQRKALNEILYLDKWEGGPER